MATAPINILRPGTFVDTHGNRVTVTRDQLVDMAESYDPADQAPFVFGHPKHDDPAMGWVAGLRMDGDTLQALPGDVTPELSEAVAAKRYRKVSASYYPPQHPSNPKPGRFTLKHVGLLGASAPAVKGLGMIPAFAADDDTAVTIPDQEPPMPDAPDPAIALAESEATVTELRAQVAQMTADAAERDRQAAERDRQARHAENVAFAEGLISAGTLAPAAKDRVVGIMDQLDAVQVVSFGEGDADQATPLAAFRGLFDAAHPVVALGEVAPAEVPGPRGASVTVSFAAPPGYTVTTDQGELHARAKAIQTANPGMAWWDAVSRARAEATA